MKHRYFQALTGSVFIAAILVSGCYRTGLSGSTPARVSQYRDRSSGRYDAEAQMPEAAEDPASTSLSAKRMPWEAWPLDRNLLGEPLNNPLLLRGDAYIKAGQRASALGEYLKAVKIRLTSAEDEAAVVRVASTQLALDRSRDALRTLSVYFHNRGVSAEEVDFRFALIFAYAYGREKNLEQSLAWFSRVNRLSAGRGGEHAAAASGLGLLLRSLPDEQLHGLSAQWNEDLFVSTAIGQELRRRAAARPGETPAGAGRQFWDESAAAQVAVPDRPAGELAGVIGVLLPLSGVFAPLGEKTKNGIELAFEGQAEAPGVRLAFKDTAGDPAQAAAMLRALIAEGRLHAVIGPLLADPAAAAAQVARENRVPMLALSKKSYFPTGEGIFRLGPTAVSQAASLLEECYRQLGLVRYAVVFPDDESGRELNAAFKQKAAELGLEVISEDAYYPGDSAALVKLGETLAAGRAEAIFLPDGPQAAARLVLSLPERARARLKFLGSSKWDDQQQLMMSAKALNGGIFVSPFFVRSPQPLIRQFEGAYRHRFGHTPDFLAAQGFDAGTLVLAALKREREAGGGFAAALQKVAVYEGLTGRIKVDWSGELLRRFAVVQLNGGALEELTAGARPTFMMRGNEAR